MTTNTLAFDTLFAYPEHASYNCPVRARTLLETRLADPADMLYQADGLVGWCGFGGTAAGVLYAAASMAVLEAHMARMLAHFQRGWQAHGVQFVQVIAASPEASQLWQAHGFGLQHEGLRMVRADLPVLPPDPRVEVASTDDADALHPIVQAVFPHLNYPLETWRTVVATNPFAWKLVEDARPLGYILAERTAARLMINGLGVLPDTQGRGVGRALVEKVFQQAIAEGKAEVQVLADQAPGTLAFYERCGFEAQSPAYMLTRHVG